MARKFRSVGGSLYQIAAAQLGDATRFVQLMDSNAISDPLLNGIYNLTIPAISYPSSGGLPDVGIYTPFDLAVLPQSPDPQPPAVPPVGVIVNGVFVQLPGLNAQINLSQVFTFGTGLMKFSYTPPVTGTPPYTYTIQSRLTNNGSWTNLATGITSLYYIISMGVSNLIYPSVNGSPTAWPVNGTGTVTLNSTAVLAPDGTNSSTLLVADATTGIHGFNIGAVPAYVGNTYTASVYVKAGVSSKVEMDIRQAGSDWPSGSLTGVYDLGAVSATCTAGGGSATILAVANGWYRLTLTSTVSAAQTAFPIWLYVLNAAGSQSYSGTTNHESAYFWGLQVEIASVAGSYVPTTTQPAFQSTATPDSFDFRVAAVNAAGTGPFSAPLTKDFRPPAPPVVL